MTKLFVLVRPTLSVLCWILLSYCF